MVVYEIRILAGVWEKVINHLFKEKGEHFAFLKANAVTTPAGVVMLAHSVELVDDADIEPQSYSAQLKTDALLRVVNNARATGSCLVEIHNHMPGHIPRFSSTDEKGFIEFIPYIMESLQGKPYCALVATGKHSVYGLMWLQESEPHELDSVNIVGAEYAKIGVSTGKLDVAGRALDVDGAIHDRQIRALGHDGQNKIANVRVGIVGVGGVGSHIAQQLAYLGVRRFVLVDPDKVEDTNLNRLVGATPGDIGKLKVDVTRRVISAISPAAVVNAVPYDLQSVHALCALKTVDVIFGCVDKSSPRLILNELALAYLVPYFDCGTGINLDSTGKMTEAGGQMMFVQPEGPCMLCAKLVDLDEAYDELASEAERSERRRLGYVEGRNVPNPSVVSLNGVIASLTVAEFMAVVAGFRPVCMSLNYDLLAKRGPIASMCQMKLNPSCIHTFTVGIGDHSSIERYVRKETAL